MNVVINKLKLCNQERVEQLNDRIYARHVPNFSPQMAFDPRPTPTKYVAFPIGGASVVPTPIVARPSYNLSTSFLPGDSAPWNGFDVNQESKLKNIIFALQKCPQATYVPSSNSELFQRPKQVDEKPEVKPHIRGLNQHIFYNDTRQQIKDS